MGYYGACVMGYYGACVMGYYGRMMYGSYDHVPRGTRVSPRYLVNMEYLSNRWTKMESVFCV